MKSTEFRRPGPLESGDEPTQKVRCPIHGFIHYSRNERKIIDHPIFRRLRAIRQLALTSYIYPGATHTRFEHSLGVMEVVTRAFESICSRHGATLERHFGEYPYFRGAPLDRVRQVLRLAALLHDSGHAPFSHAAETIIQKGGGHEELSVKIIKSEFEGDDNSVWGLRSLLDDTWGEGTSDNVAYLIKNNPPHLQFAKDLISGEIDADRIDYLLRDSHYCGVDYGRFDHRRLIECLAICSDEEGIPQVALQESGLHTYEALILARFQMNVQVYYHRLRRIYDHYLKEFHKDIQGEVFTSPGAILRENDFTMMYRIQKAAEDPTEPGHFWAKRIVDRRHHAEIHAIGPLEWSYAGAEEEKRFRSRFSSLQEYFQQSNFILDLCEENKPISLHKLIQKHDEPPKGDSPNRDMKIIRKGGETASLGLASLILGKMPRQFKIPRIFADLKDCPLDHKPMHELTGKELSAAAGRRQQLRDEIKTRARNLSGG